MSLDGRKIGYVLKAFGRTSETFITNEIYLLESLGLSLRLFSIKKLESQQQHGVMSRIRSQVTLLPEADPVNETGFIRWLMITVPRFAGSHFTLFVDRPFQYLVTLIEALYFCFRYRSGRFSPKKVFIKEFLQAGYIAQQARDDGNIEHLHAHFCHGATTVAMFASRLAGIPFSFTAHAKDIYLEELNPGDLLPRKMGRAKFVVTCTEANRRHLDGIKPPNAAVHTIYHGLDASLFSPAEEAGIAVPLILSVGRIVEKKGFDYLVKACSIIRSHGRKFRCLIVGGADKHSETIKRLITDLKMDDVIEMRPAVTQEELKRIYEQASLFALPCLILENGDRDGIPNVLVESMAMKLPVVSTDISGIPELVQNGINGILVPTRNEEKLAEAISALLDDPQLRKRLGEAARTRVLDHFDSGANAIVLKNLFTSLTEQSVRVSTSFNAGSRESEAMTR